MPQIQAVIFDMYETLVQNSPSLWLPTFDEICEGQGLEMAGQELWDLWKPLEMRFRLERYQPAYPFKTYEQAWRECFEQVFEGIGIGDAVEAARVSVRDQGRRELYPEVSDVLGALRSGGQLKIGLLSNADNDALDPLILLHGLEFDGLVCSESARCYKPVPESFRLILEELDLSADVCLYVGDSQHDDVQGAGGVGMRTAWVNRVGAELDPALPTPDHQIHSLTELLDIVNAG
jgi:2-haloalkanoic acid dehalogenase type II